MSYINIKAIQNGRDDDVIDVEGDMSPHGITDLYFNIISHMVEFDDEDEVYSLLHMLILSHMKEE